MTLPKFIASKTVTLLSAISLVGSAQVIADENLPTPAISPDETFENTWPYQARYSNAAGFAMHYVDEGTGPETLLLLHGEPTWSYLYRNQIAQWAKHYRVIAVDHMGFGKSASPSDRSYWLQDHVDNLEKFVAALGLKDITLVMHDFGGPTGMGFAIRQPHKVKRIVSINAPLPLGQADLGDHLSANIAKSPWFQWVIKAEADNSLDSVLGQLNFTILSTLKINGFEDNSIINDTWIKAYAAPFPTPHEASGAIGWAKGLAQGKHEFAAPDANTRKTLAKIPAITIWGEKDQTLHGDEFIPLFQSFFPSGKVHKIPAAGHYSLEDSPEEISQLVINFINET